MKKHILLIGFCAISTFGISQNTFPSSGNAGIGTLTPTQPLDVRGGPVQVVNTNNQQGYTFLSRSAAPNANDSYLYTMIAPHSHLIGSSKNGSGTYRHIAFAIGGWDSEVDIKMMLENNGRLGIGTSTTYPAISQLHLASNSDHAMSITRADGTYGFRILRDATGGNINFQINATGGTSGWETKIRIGEGEGANTKLILNPSNGNVLIGKTTQANSGYKLDVNGSARFNEVVVNTTGADFVFEKGYKLMDLAEVEKYVKENNHLPGIASAKEMQEEGLGLGEMNTKLLQKVEELTLHLIEQNRKVAALESKIANLESKK